MLPIFKEYIKFLEDSEIELNLKEGYYWLDKQIIKAYDIEGNLWKIARLQIDDDLNISIKTIYNNKPFITESWNQTIERNKSKLLNLEKESLETISVISNKYHDYESIVCTSGGKDSTLTTYLARLLSNVKALFSNTSLDCADTYLHVKTIPNIEFINPDEGFYQWRNRENYIPARFGRACCTYFKEGAMKDKLEADKKYLFYFGMRNQESAGRSGYGDEWRNDKWGKRDWQGVLPIRKWTEEEVWLYILWKKLDFNSKYRKGYSRVGCAIACPYYTKSTWVLDKYWYKPMYERWHKIIEKDFLDNNKALILNCTLKEYHINWNGGIVRQEPTDEVIKEFAELNSLDVNIAAKYFNHYCPDCEKVDESGEVTFKRKIKSKEVLAMNMKLNGRNTTTFYCKKHLMERLDISKEQWNEYVQSFKQQGCDLF